MPPAPPILRLATSPKFIVPPALPPALIQLLPSNANTSPILLAATLELAILMFRLPYDPSI